MSDYMHIKPLKKCPTTGKRLTEDEVKWNEALAELRKDEELITEYCPHCDGEVEIPRDKPSNCPECNNHIMPCSVCPVQDDCDWGSDNACIRFPQHRNYDSAGNRLKKDK